MHIHETLCSVLGVLNDVLTWKASDTFVLQFVCFRYTVMGFTYGFDYRCKSL